MTATSQEQTIRDILVNDYVLQPLVGERVYSAPVNAGIDTYIYFFVISEEEHTSLTEITGLCEAGYQFDCWSNDASIARAIRKRLRKLLLSQHSQVIPEVRDLKVVEDLWEDNKRDLNAMTRLCLVFSEAATTYG